MFVILVNVNVSVSAIRGAWSVARCEREDMLNFFTVNCPLSSRILKPQVTLLRNSFRVCLLQFL